ncbi:MAG: hypothetical protein ACJ8AD_18880, partial [Gemmatimonadaceae bacterium]
SGLLIWHIDESISGNTNETHYKVALMQADGKRDLELNQNRGDAGDPFPGTAGNHAFTATSTPNSKSYANTSTCVAVTGISASGAVMTAHVQVKCKFVKETKELKKEVIKEKEFAKDFKDTKKEHKEFAKDLKDVKKEHKEFGHEKPLVDKKHEKPHEKPFERPPHGLLHGGGQVGGGRASVSSLEARIDQIESLLAQLVGGGQSMGGEDPSSAAQSAGAQPFIGSELRPDLSQGAFMNEGDVDESDAERQQGSATAKRQLDKGAE